MYGATQSPFRDHALNDVMRSAATKDEVRGMIDFAIFPAIPDLWEIFLTRIFR
jgi:hypothetical protein